MRSAWLLLNWCQLRNIVGWSEFSYGRKLPPQALFKLVPSCLGQCLSVFLITFLQKSEPKIKKVFIAFLDSMGHEWDFKINLYFSPLKSGKDLEYF